MILEDLGYTSFFEAGRNRLGLNGFPVARVISEHKEAYKVKNANGEYLAKITGKILRQAQDREDYPAVGDWVAISELADSRAVIHAILPRETVIKRKHGERDKSGEKSETQVIAANVDDAFVVESVDRDYSLNRFERYFALLQNGGVKPVIVLNKADLLSDDELKERLRQLRSRFRGIDIIPTSTVSGKGLDELKRYIRESPSSKLGRSKTYCFLGSSGVGKSSLINKLIGDGGAIKTGVISRYSGRGKHVTTARQMYFLTGGSTSLTINGIVIDNPGIREVGIADANAGISIYFDEITALAEKCKYADCTHTHEPDCRVVQVVKSGKLDKDKYANFVNFRKEAEHYKMSGTEKRKKDRQFGKFIKTAKKELKDIGHKK